MTPAAPIALRAARPTAGDIPFIMACERLEGYEKLVGRSDEAWHRAALADGRYAYFLALANAEPAGFAILRDWDAPERVTHIKRIAVTRPGLGFGKTFLDLILDRVFEDTQAYRLSLGLFPENLRARRAYEGVGFKAEGISRGSAYFGGVHRDELMMAILRPEWRARRDGVSHPRG
ncbi:MAG TPA: GNAT family protein [Roseiarcus sp.]|nr:GNAT family protein [Roseiarcus sp.]